MAVIKQWTGTEWVVMTTGYTGSAGVGSTGFTGSAGAAAVTTVVSGTLTVAGWSDNSQTESVAGVTATNNFLASPTPASYASWSENGVYASAQDIGTVTFTCGITPTVDIDFTILLLN